MTRWSYARGLSVTVDAVDGATVLTVDGVLDTSTYQSLRDKIIQAALDEPRAVIIDVGKLAVPAETAWVVFTSARWHVGAWPKIPILLVCEHRGACRSIRRSARR